MNEKIVNPPILPQPNNRIFHLTLTNLMYNKEECQVATFRDVTNIKKLARIEADNKLLQLLSSSVTHEMVTPLKCIINFSESLIKELRNSPKKIEAELILTTSKLLLA